MKTTIKLLLALACMLLFTNTLFANERLTFKIASLQFEAIGKRKIPKKVFKSLGCSSYRDIGTKTQQKGCISRKKLVLNWAVVATGDIYLLSVSTTGVVSQTSYYFIHDDQISLIDVEPDKDTFEACKKALIQVKG